MWLFDKFKPSYNFAKNIKLILQKVWVDISSNNIINWEKLLLIHDSILDIVTWWSSISKDLHIKILQDIKVYLSVMFYNEYSKNKTNKNYEELNYYIHVFDNRKLIFSEFLKYDKNKKLSIDEQIKIFDSLKINILELTYEVMDYSAIINWLPGDYFNENDKKIIREFFGF